MRKPRKTNLEKRLERAENLCREIRAQIAEHGGLLKDPTRILCFLHAWMHVAPHKTHPNCYDKPEPPKHQLKQHQRILRDTAERELRVHLNILAAKTSGDTDD